MINMPVKKKALVVFSGGQDSTTCLFWALKHYEQVYAVFFDYGQRHLIEKNSAQTICEKWNIPLKILSMNTFKELGKNSLLDHTMNIENKNELPNTFVPGRNLIFMTFAAAYAFNEDIDDIVTGVCQTDFSGYPDCRKPTMEALQNSLRLGMEKNFVIHTPLMYLTKAQTIQMALEYGAFEALAYSHTCYEGCFPPCQKCPACILRAKGFAEANLNDPLIERVKNISSQDHF